MVAGLPLPPPRCSHCAGTGINAGSKCIRCGGDGRNRAWGDFAWSNDGGVEANTWVNARGERRRKHEFNQRAPLSPYCTCGEDIDHRSHQLVATTIIEIED